MHEVYLACLVGGLLATILFAALGALGGGGHGHVHLHAGVGHAHAHAGPQLSGSAHAHALPSSQSGGSAHAHALPGSSQTAHAGADGPSQAQGSATRSANTAGFHGATAAGRAGLAAGWALSWLSPLALAAAALWFGGVGIIGENIAPRSLTGLLVVLAAAAGLLGAAFVRALMAAFVRSGTPPLQGNAVGAVGTLNAPIRSDGAGEVIYTLEGLRRSAPARSLDGATMPRGTPVVIVRRERGMAWVAPLDPLAALPTVPDAEARGDALLPSPAAGRGVGGEGRP